MESISGPRFVGRRAGKHSVNQRTSDEQAISSREQTATRQLLQIPRHILEDEKLKIAISTLPANYNFEIYKSVHRIRVDRISKVALQFPEGLLIFATTISDILTQFCPGLETLILGDVTYGACCVDDFTARALGCELLIHYAHSCLVPSSITTIKTLYVFVDISVEKAHLKATIVENFDSSIAIALVSTIQFNNTIHWLAKELQGQGYRASCPQSTPLSRGEILGCTSPTLSTNSCPQDGTDIILYVGDGRFHLESAMIANPLIRAYRYDPYSRRLTRESYGHEEMQQLRTCAIEQARSASKWGLILGTLGRQGNPHTLTLIEKCLLQRGLPYITVLMSEIFPAKLAQMRDIEAWVQVACPRLSIDWGYAFPRPLLTPYEALVALGERASWLDTGGQVYPMNYYAKDGLGRVGR